MALRIRRGTNSERLTIVPLEGELIYTTDTKDLYIGDGNTLGGVALVEAAEVVTSSQSNVVANITTFELDKNVANTSDIFVIVNGLIQVPSVDYTISNSNVLVFVSELPDESYLEVRYLTP